MKLHKKIKGWRRYRALWKPLQLYSHLKNCLQLRESQSLRKEQISELDYCQPQMIIKDSTKAISFSRNNAYKYSLMLSWPLYLNSSTIYCYQTSVRIQRLMKIVQTAQWPISSPSPKGLHDNKQRQNDCAVHSSGFIIMALKGEFQSRPHCAAMFETKGNKVKIGKINKMW